MRGVASCHSLAHLRLRVSALPQTPGQTWIRLPPHLFLARCSSSVMATKRKEPDYNRWTKDGLIKRIKHLESGGATEELIGDGELPSAAATSGPATTITDGKPRKEKKKKQKKEIDPSSYPTRYIALKLAYLGKNYGGLEFQASGDVPTIEEELWKALVKAHLIFPSNPDDVDFSICGYSKCGRTDRGVSAFGQVVALHVRSNRARRKKSQAAPAGAGDVGGGVVDPAAAPPAPPAAATREEGGAAAATEDAGLQPWPEDDGDGSGSLCPIDEEIAYCKTLNRLLPPDIRVLAWCPAPSANFSARFSCGSRSYRYFFTQPAYSPAPGGGSGDGSWLDIDAMRRAARHFVGLRDFRNFCKMDGSKQITNFQRHVLAADIAEVADAASALPYLSRPDFRPPAAGEGPHPKVYSFDVTGTAFLWHQIRHMMAVLFLVGQGLEPPDLVAQLLDVDQTPRRPAYVMAADTPLVLWDCVFPAEGGGGGGGGEDALPWIYAGAEAAQNPHESFGLVSSLWKNWHEKKMDEILANRLLDQVTKRAAVADWGGGGAARPSASQKVYDGGCGPSLGGSYVPVMEKPLLATPEEVNEKYAQKKGFASADEMRKARSLGIFKNDRSAGGGMDEDGG